MQNQTPTGYPSVSNQSAEDEFHERMKADYAAQHGTGVVNQYHVQAKLTANMHKEFFQFLKQKDWSISRGVKFAIYQLLNSNK